MKPNQARRARKVGGKFQAEGHVVSSFTNRAGELYYVFEFDVPPGMLHIYTPAQVEIYPELGESEVPANTNRI